MKLIPNWNNRFKFDIEKQENFRYKDTRTKEFKRKYSIEIEQNDKSKFEVHYPKSILNQIKPLNKFEDFIQDNSETITKTLYYEVDGYYAFEEILNKQEVITSILRDGENLQKYLSDTKEKEDLKTTLELICESEKRFQNHILDDTINIHYNYGIVIEPGYTFNHHQETRTKKILKKIFPKSKYILRRVNLSRHALTEGFIKIEYLKGIENITSGYKPDWNEIEQEFENGDFLLMNHPNLTLNHECYYYNELNMILELYNKIHVIDSPAMRKEIKHQIKKANI